MNLNSHSSLRETDLAAELGYLFHLLDNKKGGSAPASNFLRSFRVSPKATALHLGPFSIVFEEKNLDNIKYLY